MQQPDISRRSFLGGLLVLSAAIAIPAEALSLAPVPLIYGDGIHDDTDGLNSLFRGEPVHFVNDNATVRSTGGRIDFTGGTFLISDTIMVGSQPVTIGAITLIASDNFPPDKYLIHIASAASGSSFDAISMTSERAAGMYFGAGTYHFPLHLKDSYAA